jgi:hypothetical protein
VPFRHIQQCETAEGWTTVDVPSHTDRDRVYTVVIQDPDDLDGVLCECEGYIHRGQCRHQQEALELLCAWKEGDSPQTDEQRKNRECPRCGRPTDWVRINE